MPMPTLPHLNLDLINQALGIYHNLEYTSTVAQDGSQTSTPDFTPASTPKNYSGPTLNQVGKCQCQETPSEALQHPCEVSVIAVDGDNSEEDWDAFSNSDSECSEGSESDSDPESHLIEVSCAYPAPEERHDLELELYNDSFAPSSSPFQSPPCRIWFPESGQGRYQPPPEISMHYRNRKPTVMRRRRYGAKSMLRNEITLEDLQKEDFKYSMW